MTTQQQSTPYLADVYSSLPRLLAMFDANGISSTLGVGDRYRWAWKGIDFANGTFQGAVHGLACLVDSDLLPEWLSESSVLARIDTIINATRCITRANGSLDEIMPFESSYCVTALVAFDILRAIELLRPKISSSKQEQYLETVAPLIEFVVRGREQHGIISNHLSVAAAALARWQRETGDKVDPAIEEIVDVLLKHWSPEGWFLEYEGADPGYQTLALDYLVDFDAVASQFGLQSRLDEVASFLCWFAHPDGSFGGLYGSRNTRFLYPAGIEQLAHRTPDAAALAGFARKAHKNQTAVGLAVMDPPNFVPMFNSFCRAAAQVQVEGSVTPSELPFERPGDFRKTFDEAGLIIDKRKQAYSVVSWRKGGVVQHYGNEGIRISGGVTAQGARDKCYTSQSADSGRLCHNDQDQIVIEAELIRYSVSYPSPLDMIILRFLSLSFMRIEIVNQGIKKLLVWLLITRKERSRSTSRRTITFSPIFRIDDEWVENKNNLDQLKDVGGYQAIHMASQGYWQRGDDQS